jgi:hypothetical protein
MVRYVVMTKYVSELEDRSAGQEIVEDIIEYALSFLRIEHFFSLQQLKKPWFRLKQ